MTQQVAATTRVLAPAMNHLIIIQILLIKDQAQAAIVILQVHVGIILLQVAIAVNSCQHDRKKSYGT